MPRTEKNFLWYLRHSVGRPGECWIWKGYIMPNGYAFCGRLAHRRVYELLVGPIPARLQLDHLCKKPACVNPHHLEPVTAAVNVLRSNAPSAINALKTHCRQGHPFDAANTYWRKDGKGRLCRACRREGMKRLVARRRVLSA